MNMDKHGFGAGVTVANKKLSKQLDKLVTKMLKTAKEEGIDPSQAIQVNLHVRHSAPPWVLITFLAEGLSVTPSMMAEMASELIREVVTRHGGSMSKT